MMVTPARTPAAWALTRRCLGRRADLAEETLATVVEPALAELARRGAPYSGLLYAGLCLTSRGLRVVEFNARFGDPEAQVVLDRLGTPLAGLLAACADGDLAAAPRLTWLAGAAVTVVIAAEGYPEAPVRGDVIEGLTEAGHVPGAYVLQAGTANGAAGKLTAAGGRVLNVVGTGDRPAGGQGRRLPGGGAHPAARRLVPDGHRRRAGRYPRGAMTAGVPAERDSASQAADAGGEVPLRVSTLEIFFDLVFAFTLTQLTSVLATRLSWLAVGQVLLVFGLLWWMYGAYAWLTNSRPPVHTAERLLLLVGMAGFLIVGLAIPRGFGSYGVVLGLGYLVVVVVHAFLYYRVNANIVRVAPFNITSALLVTAAGLADSHSSLVAYALWIVALAVQLGSPLVVHPAGFFELRPAHFAERHSALLIVAIGESVAAVGIGAAGRPASRVVPAGDYWRPRSSAWRSRRRCGGSCSGRATRSARSRS